MTSVAKKNDFDQFKKMDIKKDINKAMTEEFREISDLNMLLKNKRRKKKGFRGNGLADKGDVVLCNIKKIIQNISFHE